MSGKQLDPQHPGEFLRGRVLPALHLTVSQAARDLLVTRQTLHRILAGHAAITPDMALRLEKLCGLSSKFWLDRQQSHELAQVSERTRGLLSRIPSHPLPDRFFERIDAKKGLDGEDA